MLTLHYHTFLPCLPAEKKDIAPTLVKAPKDMIVSAGQNVSLTCSFSTSSEYHHMSWYKDNKPVAFILENPDCQTSNNDCQTDPRYSPDHQIRKSNVRAYTYTQRFCLQDAVHRHAVLVIDKAGGEDEGKYTCQLFGLSSVKPLLSVTMTLQVGELAWQQSQHYDNELHLIHVHYFKELTKCYLCAWTSFVLFAE